MELRLGDILQGEELAYLTTLPAHAARLAPLPDDVHPKVREALARQGITKLYAHQAEAWDAARRGGNLIVTTGTASGKTLAFNLPVLDALAREPKNRALYLYPTKALAQDQARALAKLAVPRVRAAIYDGDTPPEQRWQIRKWANLVLTNPDMLHIGVLPRHDLWADVLHNLRYVVVDEAHVYRGVFGSHVGERASPAAAAGPHVRSPSRSSCSPRRRSRTRASSRTSLLGDGRDDDRRRRRRRAPSGRSRSGTPSCSTPSSGCARARSATRRGCMAELVQRDLRTICFAKSRKTGGADPPDGGRPSRPRNGQAARAVPRRLYAAAATRHRAAARRGRAARRGGNRRARARDRHRPPRLRDLGRLSRQRSRACASSGAARDGAGTASRCSSRRRTLSTSTSCASRRRCSAGGSRRRSSTTRIRACSTVTSRPRPSKRRSTTPTGRRSVTRRSSARRSFPTSSTRSTAGSGRARTIRRRARRCARQVRTRSR